MAKEAIAYDKAELRAIVGAFKAMEDQAVDEAKRASGALAEYLQGKIVNAASNTRNQVDDRVAQGSKVSKTSKIGEISLGFARQKFSGGASTQTLWGGSEFGSNKFKQFPAWSGKLGRGSRGWYIYPTLRAEQPELIRKWEISFDRIVKEFD